MTTRSIPPHSLATPGERTILAIPLPRSFRDRMSCPRWRAEPAYADRRGGAGAARRLGAAPASATRRNRAQQLSLRGRRAKLPALGPSGGRCGLAPRLLPLPLRPAAGPFPVGGAWPPPLAADWRRSGGALGSRGFPRLLSRGAGWRHQSRWRPAEPSGPCGSRRLLSRRDPRQADFIAEGDVRPNASSFELCRSAPPTRSLAGPARRAATRQSRAGGWWPSSPIQNVVFNIVAPAGDREAGGGSTAPTRAPEAAPRHAPHGFLQAGMLEN